MLASRICITGRLGFFLYVGTRDGLGGGCVGVVAAVVATAVVATAVVAAVVDDCCEFRLSKEVRDNLTTRPLGVVSFVVLVFIGREWEERGDKAEGDEGED